MTPTTSEREARELLAREYERVNRQEAADNTRKGSYGWNDSDRACAVRVIAAITREQREGDPRKAALDELARENERLGLSYADAPQQEAPQREQREGVTDEMVSRFLGWKFPADFAPDCGITFEPIGNKGTQFEYRREPVGTNLLTAVQARAMLEYVLAAGAPTAQQPLDDEANNAGVATGSRNSSPSESVTRGSLPPSIPQQEAPGAVATEADTFAALAKALIPFMRTSASVADAVRSVLHVLPTHPAPSDAVVEALRKLVAAAAWSATTNTPFAHNSAAVAEAKAALATRCPVVVDEDAREAIDAILSRLEGWAKAYPVDIFHEPTQEERDWLHATKPGLMDCISASMGRHMAKCVAEDLAALRAALEVPNG